MRIGMGVGVSLIHGYPSLPVTSGLTLDLNAEIVTQVAGALSAWPDQSGAAHNYSAGGGAGWLANGWKSSQPAVTWNGSSQYLVGPNWSTMVANNAATIFCVDQIDAIATDSATIYDNDSLFSEAGAAAFNLVLRSTGTTAYFVNNAGSYISSAKTFTLGAPHVFVSLHSGGNILQTVDGAGTDTKASGNTGSLGGSKIGANFNAAHFQNGKTRRRLVYNRALTVDEISVVTAHLTSLYL